MPCARRARVTGERAVSGSELVRPLLEISGPVLEVGVLAGLFVRRKLVESRVLPFWLAAILVSGTLKLVWPDVNTWTFWIAKELVHDGLYLLLGVELAAKLYGHLPQTAPRAGNLVLVVLAGTVLLVATTPEGSVVTTLLPRLTLALAFLYLGLYAIAVYYYVPLGILHHTILRGITLCLLVYTFTWAHADEDTRLAAWTNASAFAVLLVALLRAAWMRDTPAADRETVTWIWPWESSR